VWEEIQQVNPLFVTSLLDRFSSTVFFGCRSDILKKHIGSFGCVPTVPPPPASSSSSSSTTCSSASTSATELNTESEPLFLDMDIDAVFGLGLGMGMRFDGVLDAGLENDVNGGRVGVMGGIEGVKVEDGMEGIMSMKIEE
jgi:hypothetical protein